MNSAEHIAAQVQWLAQEQRLSVGHAVDIIVALLKPYYSVDFSKEDPLVEPKHFHTVVNAMIHRLRAVSDDGK